ncbi:MAG: SDR family oxidoreductase [Pirellulales bacterium]
MSKRLEGKTALVTGGGSGIGLAIARAMAAEGCRVIICGRNEQKLREAAEAGHGEVALETRTVDVADRQSVEQLFGWVDKNLGQLDILVNNAGVNIANRKMAEMSPEDWDRILAIVATGSYNCMRLALPPMRERGDGLIVNISSVSGKRGSDLGGVGYSAAKFAQTALGTTVGLEVGPLGVRVTNIYPGEVDTPILKDRPQPVTDEHRAKILKPEDVAAAVLMVACLPARAHVPELVIKPTWQPYS